MRRILCAAAVSLLSMTAVAGDVLDQSQTLTGGYGSVSSGWSLAQGFTPGVSGYLRRVRLLLENSGAIAPVTVSIQPIEHYYDDPTDTPIPDGSGRSARQASFDK